MRVNESGDLMVMSDEKIRKKLYLGITADQNISLRKNNFEITLNRYFPDVTKKYNGNTLLHYVAELYRSCYTAGTPYFDSIRILLERGLTLDEKNDNGKDFLQIICNENSDSSYRLEYLKRFFTSYRDFSIYELINNRDNDGNSIMQIILNNLKIKITALYNSKGTFTVTRKVSEIEKMFKIIKDIFEYLVDSGYNQISITNSEEKDIFGLVKSMQLNNTWKKDLMAIYYRKNPVEFVTTYFTEFKNDNLFRVKNYLQIEPESFKKSDILFVCQKKKYPLEQQSTAVEKYLELGFDPNYKINGYTFIDLAIKNKLDILYIVKITELAIKYGLDLNNCNIIETMVKKDYRPAYISRIKVLLEENGSKKNTDFLGIRIETFFDIFIQVLGKYNMDYDFEEIKDPDFIKIFLEVIDCYSFNNDLVNDYDFIEQTIMQIKEERNNSVVLNNNPITQLEVINALRTIITKRTDDKFNKFLVKNS